VQTNASQPGTLQKLPIIKARIRTDIEESSDYGCDQGWRPTLRKGAWIPTRTYSEMIMTHLEMITRAAEATTDFRRFAIR
jgi:hypothetical protein